MCRKMRVTNCEIDWKYLPAMVFCDANVRNKNTTNIVLIAMDKCDVLELLSIQIRCLTRPGIGEDGVRLGQVRFSLKFDTCIYI